MQNIIKMC